MTKMDLRVASKYRLSHKISSGDIYLGTNVVSGEEIVIKLEKINAKHQRLKHETLVYESLAGSVGIPSVHWSGTQDEYNAMVLDLLGPDLEQIFIFYKLQFSLKTVLLLADQLISRVEHVHNKSFIHNDIRPDNILMGAGKSGNQVNLIGFGLAKPYGNRKTHLNIPYIENQNSTQIASYASINAHGGAEQSRRDDMESLGYVLIYFLLGRLPWEEDEHDRMLEKKISIPIDVLCSRVPGEFETYLKHTRSLSFDEKPNYPYLRRLFRDLFKRESFLYDHVYDWTVHKYQRNVAATLEGVQSDSQNPRNRSRKDTHRCVDGPEKALILQLETRPITFTQLTNEVKDIYAELVEVEKKCIRIDTEQAANTDRITDGQWQESIVWHRTLLHLHYDFFLASQHPSASPDLKNLGTKYAMPARMWRHGIHSFLELLRHRLSDSLEHLLSFIHIAYSMTALLMETVPSFFEIWIECLGDLARYRMAIEGKDMPHREIWAVVARMWYEKAADRSPDVGRIQHHLAVLAKPNIVRELFYYTKSLISIEPFPAARDSIMILFKQLLDKEEQTNKRYPSVERVFAKVAAIQFTKGSIAMYNQAVNQYVSDLNSHIEEITTKFRTQGSEMASSLTASLFDFADNGSILFQKVLSSNRSPGAEEPMSITTAQDATFPADLEATIPNIFYLTCNVVFQRIEDENCLPFCHVVLAFLHSLAYLPDALSYLERQVPWETIVTFLNTVGRSGVVRSRFEGSAFPLSGTRLQLPEDFVMRGLIWAKHYLPDGFFEGQVVDKDERTLELPSHALSRAERCLWLGVQISFRKRWITYDPNNKMFSTTHHASRLMLEVEGWILV